MRILGPIHRIPIKNLETYFDTDEVIVDYDNRLHPQHKLSGQVIIKNGESE